MGRSTAVAGSGILPIGLAPPMAMGMVYLAMADSVGLCMANAVANQQHGQALAEAALTQVLSLIISAGGSGK